MASRSKKKTTMAKLNRESRLRERRMEKQVKKEARKRASAPHEVGGALSGERHEPGGPGRDQPVHPVEVAGSNPV
jgi:hypothetical protein